MKPPEVKEGDIENRSETQVMEDRKDDGTYIKKTVITTSHFKPVMKPPEVKEGDIENRSETQVKRVVISDGVERVEHSEKPVGIEIDENILELGPGVESPDSDNVEKKTSVREREETTSEGTWIKHKTTTVTVTSLSTTEAPAYQLIPSDQAMDVLEDAVAKESARVDQAAPVMKPPEVKEGDIDNRSETQVTEDRKDDGTYIKKTVITTSHFKPIETIVTADGVETVEKTELPVGTEIDETILELGPGVENPDSDNVEKKTSVREREETTSEGTWIKHKTTTVTVNLISLSDEKLKGYHGLSESDIEINTEVKTSEETLEDGSVIHKTTVIKTHSKRIPETQDVEGFEKVDFDKTLVGTEINENILQLEPGISSKETQNVLRKTSTQQQEEILENGSWLKKTVTTVTVGRPAEIGNSEYSNTKDQGQSFGGVFIPAHLLEEDNRESTPVASEMQYCTQSEHETDILHDDREQTPVFEEAVEQVSEIQEKQSSDIYQPLTLDELDTSLEDFPVEGDILSPSSEYEEVEEVLPDGTVVKRKVLSQRIRKTVTRKIRRVGPDGEVIEDVVTEEIPESDLLSESSRASSVMSSLNDARELTSPVPMSPVELGTPAETETERSSVRVYTDTIEGEPEIETDVQEFEETLPDGTVVKRKVIKTRQKQTIVKRVVMEGPETDLPTTEEQAQAMLSHDGGFQPDLKYSDYTEEEPQTATQVQEYEETMPDGSVVKKKIVTTTEEQMKTSRTVMEASSPPPEILEGQDDTDDFEMVPHPVEESMVEPDLHTDKPMTRPSILEDEQEMSAEVDDYYEVSAQDVDMPAVDEPEVVPDLQGR